MRYQILVIPENDDVDGNIASFFVVHGDDVPLPRNVDMSDVIILDDIPFDSEVETRITDAITTHKGRRTCMKPLDAHELLRCWIIDHGHTSKEYSQLLAALNDLWTFRMKQTVNRILDGEQSDE